MLTDKIIHVTAYILVYLLAALFATVFTSIVLAPILFVIFAFRVLLFSP